MSIALDATLLRWLVAHSATPRNDDKCVPVFREYLGILQKRGETLLIPMIVYAEFLAGFPLDQQKQFEVLLKDDRFQFAPFDAKAALATARIPWLCFEKSEINAFIHDHRLKKHTLKAMYQTLGTAKSRNVTQVFTASVPVVKLCEKLGIPSENFLDTDAIAQRIRMELNRPGPSAGPEQLTWFGDEE